MIEGAAKRHARRFSRAAVPGMNDRLEVTAKLGTLEHRYRKVTGKTRYDPHLHTPAVENRQGFANTWEQFQIVNPLTARAYQRRFGETSTSG